MAAAAIHVVYNADFYRKIQGFNANERITFNFEKIENPEIFNENFSPILDPNFFDHLDYDIFTKGTGHYINTIFESILIPLPQFSTPERKAFQVSILQDQSPLQNDDLENFHEATNANFLPTPPLPPPSSPAGGTSPVSPSSDSSPVSPGLGLRIRKGGKRKSRKTQRRRKTKKSRRNRNK